MNNSSCPMNHGASWHPQDGMQYCVIASSRNLGTFLLTSQVHTWHPLFPNCSDFPIQNVLSFIPHFDIFNNGSGAERNLNFLPVSLLFLTSQIWRDEKSGEFVSLFSLPHRQWRYEMSPPRVMTTDRKRTSILSSKILHRDEQWTSPNAAETAVTTTDE